MQSGYNRLLRFAEGEGPGSAASIVHTGQTKQEHVLTDLLLHHAVDDNLILFFLSVLRLMQSKAFRLYDRKHHATIIRQRHLDSVVIPGPLIAALMLYYF